MHPWNRLAHGVTHAAGSGYTALGLGVVVAAWLVWGFVSDFSRAWELAMTTGSPPLLFLMLILLQRAQNRDSRSSHLKLNELLLALEEPNEEVIRVETMPDDHQLELARQYRRHGSSAPATSLRDRADGGPDRGEHGGEGGDEGDCPTVGVHGMTPSGRGRT